MQIALSHGNSSLPSSNGGLKESISFKDLYSYIKYNKEPDLTISFVDRVFSYLLNKELESMFMLEDSISAGVGGFNLNQLYDMYKIDFSELENRIIGSSPQIVITDDISRTKNPSIRPMGGANLRQSFKKRRTNS